MKTGNRSNALLVELLIVIMFFMLAATVLLQVFTGASNQSTQSGQMIIALNQAQDLIDRLYASDNPDIILAEEGFSLVENTNWAHEDTVRALRTDVQLTEDATEAGLLRYIRVVVKDQKDQALISLNNARYIEKDILP